MSKGAQALLFVLCSGIIPGSAGELYAVPDTEPGLAHANQTPKILIISFSIILMLITHSNLLKFYRYRKL